MKKNQLKIIEEFISILNEKNQLNILEEFIRINVFSIVSKN